MFWGLIMEPNKRYAQVVEKPFHISQAAIDISTGDNDPCQVMVVVDGKNFLVCTLQKTKSVQVPLDLYFKSGDSIAFLTNGKCNVHLTGYLDPEYEELSEDDAEEEEEEEEEEVQDAPAKTKRKLENSNETSASKKAKKDIKSKIKAPADSSDDDDDGDEDQLQKFLDGEDIDTDENDESFKMNTSGEATDSDEEESDEDVEEEEEDKGSSDEAETTLDTSKEEATLDTSKEEAKVDMSKLSKSQRRRLKKKLQQQGKAQPQVNGVDKTKKKPEEKPKADKKKPEVKNDSQEDAVTDKKEKKTLNGGVFIEDKKVGSGPPAKPGKSVVVYYEGRLKQNNKVFDNCLKGPGFKFKLGAKEVISGWDVGIAGMKVGGKRKIICPPAMAYGAKGSPPVIPPNSTLVFDVELKNVK